MQKLAAGTHLSQCVSQPEHIFAVCPGRPARSRNLQSAQRVNDVIQADGVAPLKMTSDSATPLLDLQRLQECLAGVECQHCGSNMPWHELKYDSSHKVFSL